MIRYTEKKPEGILKAYLFPSFSSRRAIFSSRALILSVTFFILRGRSILSTNSTLGYAGIPIKGTPVAVGH
jgi:hypothetical protein